MKTFALLLFALLPLSAWSQALSTGTSDPKQLFEKGLFEEETNHDLTQAMGDYNAAVAAFDAQKKFAAMALFRLAEVEEKQGNKNEADRFRDRLSKDFPDQVPGEAKAKEEAQRQTEAWLALVDAGNYAESWNAAAAYFKAALTQKDWVQACGTVRKPLGALKSRVFKSATYKRSLPGAPDAHYVILQFNTSFETGGAVVETLTPMLEKDGQWRCSGYLIRPAS